MPDNTAQSTTHSRTGHWGYRIIGLLMLGSLFMGGIIAWRYRQSESHLWETQAAMLEAGEQLDPVGCVDEVIDWFQNCEAMAGLCDQSIVRMMGACMAAQDRHQYCEDLDVSTASTHFGNEACRERELGRHHRKACALSYRAIDAHCSGLNEDS